MAIGSILQISPFNTKPSAPPVGSYEMYVKTDNTLYLQDSGGVEYPFASTAAITQLTGDVTAVGPGSATATVNFVGGQSALNVANATIAYSAATSAATPNTIVLRDGSANFSANVITAALNGNATTSTNSTNSVNFTGSLSGDVTGTQSATIVSLVGGQSSTSVANAAIAVASATPSNTSSTLVLRNASGNFSANVITASLNGNANTATTSVNFTGSLSGDVTGTQSATAISPTVVTGKLLTGYVTGTNTLITATNTILTAFENLQAQISAASGSAITQLTGDVIASGPGSVPSTIEAIQGTAVSGTTGTGNVVFSNAPTLTGLLSGGSAIFSSTISASNLSGTNTGDVTVINTNSIALSFSGGQNNLRADLNLSATAADINNLKATYSIKSDGLFIEYAYGTPVQIGTANNIGGASGFALYDHVHNHGDQTVPTQHAIATDIANGFMSSVDKTKLDTFPNTVGTDAQILISNGTSYNNETISGDATLSDSGVVTVTAIQAHSVSSTAPTDAQLLLYVAGTSKWTPESLSGDATLADTGAITLSSTAVTSKLLTGYTTGTNTPITATNSILTAFENLQAQISSSVGSAITALTGDGTATGPGSSVFTLATVNSNVGAFGSSTAIPTITVNGKGLITGVTTNPVVAPAGTLTGTTLASNVVNSSLTSVGTIVTGVWNGTPLTAPYMLALPNNDIYVGNGSNQPAAVAMSGDVSIVASGATSIASTTVTGKLLTGYTTGTNTPIIATNSILTAFENLQAQTSAISGSAITALTGQVTATGPGSATATIATNTVTNSNLAQMAANTIKGNNTGSTANATDLTISQILAMLGAVTTIGAIDTNANSNGLFISGNTLSTQSASVSNPGMVNITTQSFAGNKTFTGTVNIAPASTSALVINSTSFVHDSVNNSLGIGVQPAATVMIDGVNTSGASKLVQMTGYGTGSTTGYRGRFARGTLLSPTATQTGDTLSAISGRGYGASQFAAASTGVMNIVAGENFTNTSNMTYLQFQATPTGSVTSAEHMRVAATGVTLGPQSASTDLHTVNGGWIRTTRTITGSLTVDTTTTDDIIFCNQSAGITITLPIPTAGRTLTIVDISGNAQTNNITIARHASELIEGLAASKVYQTNYGSLVLTADASGNWWTIG